MSPTQRCLADLKRLGAVCQVVERFCHFSKRRIDLFGFIDLLAMIGPNLIAIQVTSGSNHAARRTKLLADPRSKAWLETGNLIEIWSYSKRGDRGKRKTWQCRKEEIVAADFGEPSVA
jgi:hypothetical protein